MYVAIQHFRKEEEYAEKERELLRGGKSPTKKRSEYIKNDKRLECLTRRYDEIKETDQEEACPPLPPNPWQKGVLKYLMLIGRSAGMVLQQVTPLDEENDESA